jgi:hypothetical protein
MMSNAPPLDTGPNIAAENRADFTTPNQDAKPQKTGDFSVMGLAPILADFAITELVT